MKPLRRAELEKEHTRRRNEAEAAHRELVPLRRAHETLVKEWNRLLKERDELAAQYAEARDRAERYGRKLSELSTDRELIRVEYLAYQDAHVAMSKRLEALEKAGNDLLEFLPSEATGRARYSKHARAAVAFREALKGTP